jgi:predicted patatin/cPLA2 family phospholipase
MAMNALEQIRIRSAEIAERRSTNIRTALVVPGGVLQSICNCASLAALDSLGIKYFDTVYAVSAGAVNAAYWLANQAALGVTVYLEEANRLRFVNPLRLWRIMDLDYLFSEVVERLKPLDISAVQSNPTELRILATDVTHNRPHWFKSSEPNILAVLKASCSPEVVSRPLTIDGTLYADGFLYEPLPLLTALQEDYTDIVVLLNKPLTQPDVPVSAWIQKSIVNPWVRKQYGPDLVTRSENNWRTYNEALETLRAAIEAEPGTSKPRIAAIAPDSDMAVGMFETNTKRLFRAAFSGWRNTLRAYGREDIDPEEFLQVLEEAGLKKETLAGLRR